MSGHAFDPDADGFCLECGREAGECTGLRAAPEPAGTDDGAALLGELRDELTRYVILPSEEAADAVALWIAASHAQECWENAPRLVITAPEKRCGKSRLLDITEATVHDPLMTVNISPAALVRSIGQDPPTILLDEADTVFSKKAADGNEDLRGILNAGHQRGRPYIRWDANARQPESCPTFAMAALAGIGSMPDTITDRAVIIQMRRRMAQETVTPYRVRRDRPHLETLRDRVAAWVRDHHEELTDAVPETPVEDRAADTWDPLLAIAELAGGNWPERGRAACLKLTGEAETDNSIGTRLLRDLYEVFGNQPMMHSADILTRLCQIEDGPWLDWYGKPITAKKLGDLLHPYGVRSKNVRAGNRVLKTYFRQDLEDPWDRYGVAASPATTATPQVNGTDPVAGSGFNPLPATANPPLTREVTGVAGIAGNPQVCGACGGELFEADVLAGSATHAGCGS